MRYVYFVFGGMLLITSAVGFIYFTLFSYDAQWEQWLSACILGVVGSIFLGVSGDYAPPKPKEERMNT